MIPWIKYLLLAGAIQGFVFAFAISRIKTPKSKEANTILIVLLLFVSSFMLISSQADWLRQLSDKLILLSYILIFTYCPLYYLFTEALYTTQFKLKRRHLLLLLPATVFLVGWLRYAIMPQHEMDEIFQQRAYYDLLAADSISIFLNFFFIWKTWQLTATKHEADESSFLNRKAFIVPTIGLAIANLSWFLMVLSSLGFPLIQLSPRPDILYLSMSFLILLFGYFIIIRTELFSVQGMIKAVRYQNVNIETEQCEKIETEIIEALIGNEYYKNSEFTLTDLAELTGIDKVKLSYTINSHMNTNFSSLINKYRVTEFIRLMESGIYENYSMLGVATEAGFSSKSTFYKAFKDLKGQTPREYFANLPTDVRN